VLEFKNSLFLEKKIRIAIVAVLVAILASLFVWHSSIYKILKFWLPHQWIYGLILMFLGFCYRKKAFGIPIFAIGSILIFNDVRYLLQGLTSYNILEAVTLLNLKDWFFSLPTRFNYLGVFFLSLIGAASVIIPIPYTVVIFWLGAYTNMNFVLLSLVSGFGSATGEIIGYSIGYAAQDRVKESHKRKFKAILQLITRYRYATPILLFIFALMPLPDDLLFIPLGLLHYSLWKAVIPCFLGKTLMSYILLQGGRVYNELILSFLGGESSLLISIISTVVTTVLLIIMVVIIWKVDWEKILERNKVKRNSDNKP
jgi:membrane protein YqaA with SNARE-associated domain